MFSYYDKNMDNTIVRDEIWEIWVTEPFQRMFASCTLMDMFRFENILDDEIQEGEFLKAFGKCKPSQKFDTFVISKHIQSNLIELIFQKLKAQNVLDYLKLRYEK